MANADVDFTSDGAGNLPSINNDGRLAGGTWIRKWFAKAFGVINTVTKTTLMLKPTPSNDTRAFMIQGTQRDTVATMGTRKYGTGQLNTAISDTDTVLIVDFEAGQGADNVVQAGDTIRVVEDLARSAFLTVDSVVWTVDQAEITLTTAVGASFTTAAIVGSCIVDTTNNNPSFDNVVKSFASTAYDESAYPILLDRVATIEETVTITVIDSTSFSAVSDKRGVLPNGTFATDYQPIASGYSSPSFILQAAGWGGTPTANDTLQFQVHPSGVPVFINYEVLAGAAAITDQVPFFVWIDAN